MRKGSLGGRIEANLRQDQGILGDTSHVTSSKGKKSFKMYIAAQEWAIGAVLLKK
jgi:hypothetical protein